MKYLYTKEQRQKMYEAIDRLEKECKAIAYEKENVPETFAADIRLLFGFDEKTDFINDICYSEGGALGLNKGNLIMVPKEIENNAFLVALSDYVNAFEMDRLCLFIHDNSGKLLQYEILKNDDSIEGGSEVSIIDDGGMSADDANICFHAEITYGTECGEPSQIAKDIKGGKHFIKSFWDDNGEIFNCEADA